MASSLCRVCTARFEDEILSNIFEGAQGLSIASMIAECTGYEVEKGDRLSEYICTICLKDAQNAFEIKQMKRRGKKQQRLKAELFEEELVYLSDCDDQVKIRKTKSEMENHVDLPVDIDIKHSSSEKHQPKSPHASKPFAQLKLPKDAKPFKCSQCPKIFLTKAFLEEHLRNHPEDRRFQCSHCTKRFARRATLLRHQLTHTGERPYHCSHCSSTFNQTSSLNRHMKIHTEQL
ncbi:zinc finger protein 502 isoform X2 [Drosophila erecta]|uniref:zinc finger protein 502 isoform X2 n=1 Tax=Drosophila erecta TaxID=7220 RepID=UPI000F063811|nr:zinc finger protein 502 isoform X2 [Drosophila erecta]